MKASLWAAVLLVSISFGATARADVRLKSHVPAALAPVSTENDALDELDPFSPNVQQTLEQMDQNYEDATGLESHLPQGISFFSSCYRESCGVYARVEKAEQRLYLYVNGSLYATYATSTGVPGRDTPNFDTHPDGRIYDFHTSSKFPGGDYNGLGNMPYAVFISGGFAIHGTGRGNWPKLGRVASHGCIRIHPDNAYVFNQLVRQYGVANTWITVE